MVTVGRYKVISDLLLRLAFRRKRITFFRSTSDLLGCIGGAEHAALHFGRCDVFGIKLVEDVFTCHPGIHSVTTREYVHGGVVELRPGVDREVGFRYHYHTTNSLRTEFVESNLSYLSAGLQRCFNHDPFYCFQVVQDAEFTSVDLRQNVPAQSIHFIISPLLPCLVSPPR